MTLQAPSCRVVLVGLFVTLGMAATVAAGDLSSSQPPLEGPALLARATAAPYAPVVEVVDTVSSLGPLAGTLRAADGCPPDLSARVGRMQADFALSVLDQPPGEVFTVSRLDHFPYDAGNQRPDTTKASCSTPDAPGRVSKRPVRE